MYNIIKKFDFWLKIDWSINVITFIDYIFVKFQQVSYFLLLLILNYVSIFIYFAIISILLLILSLIYI